LHAGYLHAGYLHAGYLHAGYLHAGYQLSANFDHASVTNTKSPSV
jgi:hypothetical protein